ncbi:MAG: hybrid sensor histidine kinase/response regulator, partial [Planctomycetota bacterium]
MPESKNDRILLIDDTRSIHEDFKKILGGDRSAAGNALADAKAAFLGKSDQDGQQSDLVFDIDSAYQGQEGLELL